MKSHHVLVKCFFNKHGWILDDGHYIHSQKLSSLSVKLRLSSRPGNIYPQDGVLGAMHDPTNHAHELGLSISKNQGQVERVEDRCEIQVRLEVTINTTRLLWQIGRWFLAAFRIQLEIMILFWICSTWHCSRHWRERSRT